MLQNLIILNKMAGNMQQPADQMQMMMNEINHLHGVVQQLQNAAAAAAAQPAPPPQVVQNVNNRLLDKPMKPRPFTGGSSAGGMTADFWTGNMERYFNVVNLTSQEQVLYAASFLQDAAGQWWDSVGANVTTWSDMKRLVLERYRPPGASQVARDQLDVIKQRGSVSGYTDVFRTILNRVVGMDMLSIVHAYIKGLHPSVRAEVHRSAPTTLENATLAAQRAEQLIMLTSSTFRSRSSYYNSYSSNGSSVTPSSSHSNSNSSGAAPMDINNISMSADQYVENDYSLFYASLDRAADGSDVPEAVQSQLNAIQESLAALQVRNQYRRSAGGNGGSNGSNLTPEERQKLFTENKCFKCREVGHIARNCNIKK